MSNQFNTRYRPCPKCTYPLAKCILGTERNKKGVLKEIVRTYCTNKSCPEQYERITRRTVKWQ